MPAMGGGQPDGQEPSWAGSFQPQGMMPSEVMEAPQFGGMEGCGCGAFPETEGQPFTIYDPSAGSMQQGAMVAVECQGSGEAGGQGGEEGWNLCWEWVKTGWCPRGMSCRWDHPAMGAVAAFGFWGEEGEDGQMPPDGQPIGEGYGPCGAGPCGGGMCGHALAVLTGDLAPGVGGLPQTVLTPQGMMVQEAPMTMPQESELTSTPRGD